MNKRKAPTRASGRVLIETRWQAPPRPVHDALTRAVDEITSSAPTLARSHSMAAIRGLVALLKVKIASMDYDATRLSPQPSEDAVWHALLLRPKLYARVCDILGASQTVDHNPDGAEQPEAVKAQRRRAAKAEIEFLGVDPSWLTAGDDDGRKNDGDDGAHHDARVGLDEGILMNLFVNGVDGSTSKLKARPSDTIGNILRHLQRIEGISVDQVRLCYDGNYIGLYPKRTLSDFKIEDGSTLELITSQTGC